MFIIDYWYFFVKGCFVVCGVLIDFKCYIDEIIDKMYDFFDGYRIIVEEIEVVVKY